LEQSSVQGSNIDAGSKWGGNEWAEAVRKPDDMLLGKQNIRMGDFQQCQGNGHQV